MPDLFIPDVPRDELVNITFKPSGKEPSKEFRKKLQSAMNIGNDYKIKVRIVFETNNGIMSTKTTIWMVGKQYILVKGNIAIPINSIWTVE